MGIGTSDSNVAQQNLNRILGSKLFEDFLMPNEFGAKLRNFRIEAGGFGGKANRRDFEIGGVDLGRRWVGSKNW